ncbi:phosphoribosylpyrophosphate synthetase [Erwinia phage Hena1]|uniref:Phosphoribosylpyrophosphate synthetase n=1 Tax=Erwinia phage Hena1 TaxID=2678601 RepID=A0A6B9JB75_9CAUD|nr:ribose-phosphate pyrophosphokinase [Erwinia phage Hena1]QGZ16266.1 phosphoribosylpyrophosphate synthetase [Erwinia phage Hena1]
MNNVTLQLNNLQVPVKHFTFNGGEEQVVIDQAASPKGRVAYVDITAKLKSSMDVMTLVMLTDACRHIHNLDDCARFTLHMPYIPYARQDRVMNAGEAAAVKAFVNVIAGLKFDKIVVADPHSDVATNLLDNIGARLEVISQDTLFSEYMGNTGEIKRNTRICTVGRGNPVIVAPDAGARKKAQKVADRYGFRIVEAGKVRDVRDGKITGTSVHDDVTGLPCIIVDDICDGGRTFVPLAAALKEKGASQVILYVTHGIFSNGKQFLLDAGIEQVHAYYDWKENF